MKKRPVVKILHLEDDPNDAHLIARRIQKTHPEWDIHHSADRATFEHALGLWDFDIILSDHKIPGFTGKEALALARARNPEIPFLFVTGTISEADAIEALRLGAADYIAKDTPHRLVPGIERALDQADERHSHQDTEVALARSEARFRTLVERAPIGVYLLQEGQIIYANLCLADMLGYSCDELRGIRLESLIVCEDRTLIQENFNALLNGEVTNARYEVSLLRKDRMIRQVELHGALTEVRGSVGTIGTILDNTEKKQMEAQVFRAQRLESLGAVASGIAHDLSNVLFPVSIAVETLKSRGAIEKDEEAWFDIIEKSVQRGMGMVERIVTFARGSESPRTLVNLGVLIREQERILRKAFPQVKIIASCPGDLRPVLGNETELYQAIMNLCVNARDAIADGGRLEIIAENCVIDETAAEKTGATSLGNFTSICVKDTGVGISPEMIEKVFDPFFTTKGRGDCAGLGLAVASRIVKRNGGFITVSSEVAVGSRFTIYLPSLETA